MLSMLKRPKSRSGRKANSEYTKNIARERLQNAISRDRYDLLAVDLMDALSRDMLAAISRHLEVGDEFHELEIRRLDQSLYLVASVRIQAIPRWSAVG